MRERTSGKYRYLLLTSGGVLVALSTAACPTTDPGDTEPCSAPGTACSPESDERGSWARSCAVVEEGTETTYGCLNVCFNAADFEEGGQGAGDTCEYDVDCEAGTHCDNDVVGGAATCTCLVDETCSTDLIVGRLVEFNDENTFFALGEAWSYTSTCRYTDESCEESDETIGIAQDTLDTSLLRWIFEGTCSPESCPTAEAQLCGSDATWTRTDPSGVYQTGQWHFTTEDTFQGEVVMFESEGGLMIGECMVAGRRSSEGSAETPIDCDDYHPFDCAAAFDISGTFEQRFKCTQTMDGTEVCVDPVGEDSLTFVATGDSAYTFTNTGSLSGIGQLCANIFTWSAEDSVFGYTESGVYVFTDADTFVADTDNASTYGFTDGSGFGGQCTATGSRVDTPDEPAPVGVCP